MIFNWVMGVVLLILAVWASISGDRQAFWGFLVVSNVFFVASGMEARITKKLEAHK